MILAHGQGMLGLLLILAAVVLVSIVVADLPLGLLLLARYKKKRHLFWALPIANLGLYLSIGSLVMLWRTGGLQAWTRQPMETWNVILVPTLIICGLVAATFLTPILALCGALFGAVRRRVAPPPPPH